jgi:hypothetical protein
MVVQDVIITEGGQHGVRDPGRLQHPWALLRNPRVFCLQHSGEETRGRERREGEAECERERERERERGGKKKNLGG